MEVVSDSRTGPLFDCDQAVTLEGTVTDSSGSPGEGTCDSGSQPNRFGRRSLLAEDTPVGPTGALAIFHFDLPLECIPGETYSIDFRTTETDPQIGVRLNGDPRTLDAGLPSDISFSGATLLCLDGTEPTRTPTPTLDPSTPTATVSPTLSPTQDPSDLYPLLAIDLNRSEPGVQSDLEWVFGNPGAVEGALVVRGQPDWEAGSYALEVLATNGESNQTVIDCGASDFRQGDVGDSGGAFTVELCTGRTFRRTSLFAVKATIGEDHQVDLLHFDLSIRCRPGDRLEFSLTGSESNSLLGVEVEGRNYTIGMDSRQPIRSSGATILCVEPSPTPTSTPSPTPFPVGTLQSEGLIEIIEGIRAGTHDSEDLILKSLGWME